ncbi:MAG: type II toxin-antitoxin system VapC family toxin [Terriglobales bacterium]
MASLLLDTHALLWWLSEDQAMPDSARKLIANKSNTVMVSAASAWEIATKVRLGKLNSVAPIVEDFSNYLANERFLELAITTQHGIRAGSLPGPHRDPFDRMLIAQALEEDLRIISNEQIFDNYGVTRFW